MPQTTFKGLEVQVTGSNSGTWGDVLNDSMISFVDLMLGGITSVSLAAVDVTLTASQARNAIVRFTGLLLANVKVTTPCQGFTFFDNATTGNFTVEIEYTAGAGASVFIEQGVTTLVAIDATNGVRIANAFPDLMAINALTGTGILKRTGTDTWSLNTGVTDLANTTANRLYGTNASGVSGLITTDSSLAVAAGVLAAVPATQAQMESQSATAPTFPSVQKFHPGHPKAGGNLNGEGTPAFRSGDYGMGAVTDNGVGLFTCAFDTAFADTNYWLTGWARLETDTNICAMILSAQDGGTKSTSQIALKTAKICGGSGGADENSPEVGMSFWGDYA